MSKSKGKSKARPRRVVVNDPTLPLSAASLMLSFRTMVDRARAAERPMTAGFRLGPEIFVARIDRRGVAVTRAEPGDCDLVFTGDARGVAAVVYGGMPLAAAEKAGLLAVSGNRALARRFVTLFPLPEKIGAA